MRISIIAAMAENRVIGREGRIPWHIPADLARFREITMGYPLIMGRRTYESIGKALAGRSCIVLTRRQGYVAPGCVVLADLEAALAEAGDAAEVFICGGGELYREAMPLAGRIYLTIVRMELPGDTFFPAIPGDFRVVKEEELTGEPRCTFLVMERLSLPSCSQNE